MAAVDKTGLVLYRGEIGTLENVPDLFAAQFRFAGVGQCLYGGAELDLHAAGHGDMVIPLQQESDAALARLAVDPHDAVIGPPQVLRIDRQVRNTPGRIGFLRGEALGDGILVRAGEGGEDQVADIGGARMDGQGRAFFRDTGYHHDVGKIQSWGNALRIEIQRQYHDIGIAAALAIAEQAAFDTLRARQHGLFGAGHANASVIVGMHGQDQVFAPLQSPIHPFDLVGKHVGRRDFYRGRQVDDHRSLWPGVPGPDGGVADLQRYFQLGHAKCLGGILQDPFSLGMGCREPSEQGDMRSCPCTSIHRGI